MFTSLSHRQLEGELMDAADIDDQTHRAALRGLRRINVASRTAAVLWPCIRRLAEARPHRPLTLLDIATGGGDVAIELACRARRAGISLEVEACDISPTALHVATDAARRQGVAVRCFHWDARTEPLPRHYHIVTSTLFLHHLDDPDIVALLRQLSCQAEHLLISDLLRCHLGYGLAYFGTRLLSSSTMVHEDGVRSVRAALTLSEARRLASEAGLRAVSLKHHWPSRFLMQWSSPALDRETRS
ncbi:MAG TPA: methyltransferase domain-containing protein [Halomonas sp.]|nr:methyltransferase domain-containing protein [Halomonas sp.]